MGGFFVCRFNSSKAIIMSTHLQIEYAVKQDHEWLLQFDKHISAEKLHDKIQQKEVLIASEADQNVALIRFGWFWDTIPFMNMLWVIEEKRHIGIGKALVQFWEEEMRKGKHDMVLTSTLSNEPAQHFYRKIGYTDSGGLLLPEEPMELFFRKDFG